MKLSRIKLLFDFLNLNGCLVGSYLPSLNLLIYQVWICLVDQAFHGWPSPQVLVKVQITFCLSPFFWSNSINDRYAVSPEQNGVQNGVDISWLQYNSPLFITRNLLTTQNWKLYWNVFILIFTYGNYLVNYLVLLFVILCWCYNPLIYFHLLHLYFRAPSPTIIFSAGRHNPLFVICLFRSIPTYTEFFYQSRARTWLLMKR